MWNYILIALIILNFIFTILLIVQSDKNDNKIGTNVGYILMIFLLIFPIGLYLVGKYFVEYYNFVFIFVFGILILYIAVILLVGLSTNLTENFSQGICFENGKQGYIINGVCDITNTENCEKAVQQSIRETCPQSVGARSVSSAPKVTANQESFGQLIQEEEESFVKPNQELVMGICSYIDNGKTNFGFRHPDRGRKCISKQQMLEELKRNPKQILKGISYNSNPFQSTTCQKYPKTDYISFDIECKKKFGINYGLKLIENQGCAPNDYRATCEAGWQAGVKLPDDSTKCVPVGKDMNVVCQTKHIDDKSRKFGNYLRIGYKTIEFSGCPQGSQRAICDGNYFDGKELFQKTTVPFPQTENPNRKCQEKFGLLSFAKRIISENCSVGYVRAECN
jgi:hypothetical protein